MAAVAALASSGNKTGGGGGSQPVAALQSIQGVAPIADPSGPASGFGRAAATVAAIAVAGAGGGFATGLARHGGPMPVPGATRAWRYNRSATRAKPASGSHNGHERARRAGLLD